MVSIFSLGVGRMWEVGECRGGKERGKRILKKFFKRNFNFFVPLLLSVWGLVK